MKYIHLRSDFNGKQKDKWGRLPSTPPTKFCAVSIGYTTVTDPDSQELCIHGQAAFCKRPDQFNRDISHKIIEGRMKKHGPNIRVVVPEGFTVMDILSRMYHPDFGSEI